MIRRWYFPEWSGDFRLEADGDDKCILTVVSPTPAEIEQLGAFLKKTRSKDWIAQHLGFVPNGEVKIPVAAPLAKAGKVLLGRKIKGVMTAIVSAKGEVTAIVDGTPEKVEEKVGKPDAKAATTVRRPTNCCPMCEPGPDTRANEVLLEFCTPAQRASWERDGLLHCYGNLSGRKYEVAHRHHPLAVERGKILWDCEGGYVLHAYDWSVPAAEEALVMKLAVEHCEPWIRNSASGPRDGPVYENPSTDAGLMDGVDDAAFMSAFGRQVAAMIKLFGE